MPATGKPHAAKGETCPFHRCDVSKVCHTCPLFIKLRGKDPQSQNEIDEWGCSFAFLPILLIENAQQSRLVGAEVNAFRNEMVTLSVIPLAAKQLEGTGI